MRFFSVLCAIFFIVTGTVRAQTPTGEPQPGNAPNAGDESINATVIRQSQQLYMAGNPAQAQKVLEVRLAEEKSPQETVRLLFTLAELHFAWARNLDAASDFAAANEHYSKAHAIDETLRPRYAAAELNNLGINHWKLNHFEEAKLAFHLSLSLQRALDDEEPQGVTLDGLGRVYASQGNFKQALKAYNQALVFHRKFTKANDEALTLNNMGIAYDGLGNYYEALQYFQRALAIQMHMSTPDERGEGTTLNNIGGAYWRLSQYAQAIHYFTLALPKRHHSGDKAGESATLNDMGLVYYEIGRSDEAIQCYLQAFKLGQELHDLRGQATVMSNMGSVYSRLNHYPEALNCFGFARNMLHQLGDPAGEATLLNNMGVVYANSRRIQDALHFFNLAEPTLKHMQSQEGLAALQLNRADAYWRLKRYPESLRASQFALKIFDAAKDRRGEATVFNNRMMVYRSMKQLDLAIVDGKRAVNLQQDIRREIQTLDKRYQRTFLATYRGTYETLAAILVEQNRLEEAEQVLRYLRLEDAYEFARRDPQLARELGALLQPLSFTAAEKALLPASASVKVGVGATESRLWQKCLQDREKAGDGRAALISTFNTEEAFYVLLCTAKGRRAFSFPISKTEFDALGDRLLKKLSNPSSDPREDAHTMEQIVFCQDALEQALQKESIQIALWFTSGALRSIPIDALYNGKQYLIEKSRTNVNETLTSRQLLGSPPQGQTLAVGVSQEHTVPSPFQDKAPVTFEELRSVPDEVRSIVRDPQHQGNGPFQGQILLDGDFSLDSFQRALTTHPTTVHIATHFALGRDEENSFLLLGDGKTLPLWQWRQKLSLKGVSLLTLSACDTGVGRDAALGSDVSSLGEISQWLGAQSVLVSLWPVSDPSTATLMAKFYAQWHRSPLKGKLAALRDAQLRLLGTSLSVSDGTSRGPIRVGRSPLVGRGRYSHPYYWAPFTLVGNWR